MTYYERYLDFVTTGHSQTDARNLARNPKEEILGDYVWAGVRSEEQTLKLVASILNVSVTRAQRLVDEYGLDYLEECLAAPEHIQHLWEDLCT